MRRTIQLTLTEIFERISRRIRSMTKTIGREPKLTLLKLIFRGAREEIVDYLIDQLETTEEQEYIRMKVEHIGKDATIESFGEIEGFNDLTPELKKMFALAAIDYADAQGGGKAARQRITKVEQRKEDVKKWGPTAIRMWLRIDTWIDLEEDTRKYDDSEEIPVRTYEKRTYAEYQLCINGKYGY